MMLGLNDAHSMYACVWCKVSNNQRSAYYYVGHAWADLRSERGKLTHENLWSWHLRAKIVVMLQSIKY